MLGCLLIFHAPDRSALLIETEAIKAIRTVPVKHRDHLAGATNSIVYLGQTNAKLAIARADAQKCYLEMRSDGGARMAADRWPREGHRRRYLDLPPGSFPADKRSRRAAEAIVPLIPIDIRPKRGIENYHVLFEAIWRPVPPVDPMLLRRIGEADLWVVCAAWELTEVERVVLGSRM